MIVDMAKLTGNLEVWSVLENKEVQWPYDCLADFYLNGNIETLRFPLENLVVNQVKLPLLKIALKSRESISFDYQMGKVWSNSAIEALFELLVKIKLIAPKAKIFHAFEGTYASPSKVFSKVLESYCSMRHIKPVTDNDIV